MKKITLIILVFITSLSSFAQDNENKNEDKIKKHEVKLNAFNIIIFKSIDFTYEYLLDSESSVGISVLINLNDFSDEEYYGPYYNEAFAITPYYRHFFSRKYAAGFFMEAFGMYNQQKYYVYNYDVGIDPETTSSESTSNNFALGISLGGKFVSKKGFLFEFFGGVGRNIAISNRDAAADFVPRMGATIGYRF
ncbi:MAG: DUF3575 domain-containing protein [Urechidicola sp.]|nr:DUF3575 domain-containing protein [Urechidicola sp.]